MVLEKQIEVGPNENNVYMAVIRRSPHSLYLDVNRWFMGLGAKTILSHAQSESDGNITITIFYRKD